MNMTLTDLKQYVLNLINEESNAIKTWTQDLINNTVKPYIDSRTPPPHMVLLNFL